MDIRKKRIGLVVASIHTGAFLDIWPSFAKIAAAEGAAFFVFPAGRVNARLNWEYLRNSVYSLVNDENLDGLISWSSTIGYGISPEEFNHFHTQFDPVPYVTVGYKVPGHPCIDFDACKGIKTLVSHFIREHGARRIAFLRGPNDHQSAMARLRGYHDALKEAGLEDPPERVNALITDPFAWDSGEKAAAQLFETRGLAPGRDFDTLIGSSDMMVFAGINYFLKKGYHVPVDYFAGGFNNSVESKLLEYPLSTVQLPYMELSRETFNILCKQLRKEKKRKNNPPIEDVLLEAIVIIRESCGCGKFFVAGDFSPPLEKTLDSSSAVDRIMDMAKERLKISPHALKALLFPALRSFFFQPEERFFHLFERALLCYFYSGLDRELLIKFIGDLFASGIIPEDKASRTKPLVYEAMLRIQERLNIRMGYEKEQWNTVLNVLKCELLGALNRSDLVQNLARYLPRIGITTAAIILYEDEKISVCVGSFSPEGLSAIREERFPSRLLVPVHLKSQYAGGTFLVQPLFIENRSLGYFVHNISIYDGIIFEELRSAVSYALKGIFLIEDAVRARRIAEQAERAKTEFLQTMENEIYDPLSGVMERLEGLEKEIASGGQGLINDIRLLKSFVACRESEADSLIELTMSRINDLTLRKTLFDPEELLPGIGVFPLLCGDPMRLSQCFSMIREEYHAENGQLGYSAALTNEGLAISFRGQAGTGDQGTYGMLLAERIIFLHGGELRRDQDSCVLTLPWISLTGWKAVRQSTGRQDHILCLSDPDLLPANLFDLPLVRDIEQAARFPGRTAFIAWNTEGALAGDLVTVAALRHRSEFIATPVLCYGKGLSAGTFHVDECLIDVVERILRSPKKGPILIIGSRPQRDVVSGAAAPGYGEEIHIESMSFFNETVTEIIPVLVILHTIDSEATAVIRQHPLTVMVPIIMICDQIDSAVDVNRVSQFSRLIICHRAVAFSPEFRGRVKALIEGDGILPPHTGALVKKTLLYFDRHIESPISRWKLAEEVNVSEDYLTRIFHREMGLSLWDYLIRCRVFFSAGLLLQTDETIQEIAFRAGFQDQSYFCRVFKKICGVSPGQYRKTYDPAE
jgi:DNA-binding LacI/PurR family transcriptional regulator/AraC-like DNA-binding protein